jgi:site-specific recombinase XerD
MPDPSLLGVWVRRFLLEHLVSERNLARNTQQSYRDTLALLLPFAATQRKRAVDRLLVCDLSSDTLKRFLDSLERQRNCSIRTRNQRLSAIHAMARFIAERSPEHIEWCNEIRSVPFKRFNRPTLPYLDKLEIDALLAAPDRGTSQGRRDHAVLLFLYNSGARATETACLRVADLDLRPGGINAIKLNGKGGKTRFCPLWATTAKELLTLTQNRTPDQSVFLNRLGQAITRHGIYAILRRYVVKAAANCPSLLRKRISPHTVRHTTATHLLRSGVDINTIRSWLGHVSIDTTNIYAETDLEQKAHILAHCGSFQVESSHRKHWRDEPSLMSFLRSL